MFDCWAAAAADSVLAAGEIRRAIQGEMKKGLLPNVLKRSTKDLVELSVSAAAGAPAPHVRHAGLPARAGRACRRGACRNPLGVLDSLPITCC